MSQHNKNRDLKKKKKKKKNPDLPTLFQYNLLSQYNN